MPRFVDDRSLDSMRPHGSVARPILSARKKRDFSPFEVHYAHDDTGRPAINNEK